MTCELSGNRLDIPPNSAMFDMGHLLILVRAGRMGSTFKRHSACKCAYTLPLPTRDLSTFPGYQIWQEIFILPHLDIWLMNWPFVILGHLCFGQRDFTVRGRSPPLQSLWSLEQLQLHGWCFWTWSRLVPGGSANSCCQILLTPVRISSGLYLGLYPMSDCTLSTCNLGSYGIVYRMARLYFLLGVWQLLFWCMRRRCFPSIETAIQGASVMCSCGHFSGTRSLVITKINLRLKHDEPQHRAGCRQRCH